MRRCCRGGAARRRSSTRFSSGDASHGHQPDANGCGARHGPAASRRAGTPIGPRETGGELHDRLAAARRAPCSPTRCRTCSRGGARRPAGERARYRSRRRSRRRDAPLDWRRPAAELERRVRAFNPWPVAESVARTTGAGSGFGTRARSRPRPAPPPGTRSSRRAATASTSRRRRRAAAAAHPAAFGTRDGRRPRISRRIRSKAPPLSTKRRRAGASCCAPPLRRLIARVLRERVPADDALAAAPRVADRDARAARRARVRRAALASPARMADRAAADTGRSRPARSSSRRCCASGCCSSSTSEFPQHAAVSATVDAAAELGLRDARGLVNAVLRRYQRERDALEAAARETCRGALQPSRVARRARSSAIWPDDWQGVLEANNAPAPMWLRVNRRKIAQGRLSREARIGRRRRVGRGRTSRPPWRSTSRATSRSCPGSRPGEVSVQDVAAQRAPRRFSTSRAGQRVLDACAAPGGKTGHILEACPRPDGGLGASTAIPAASRGSARTSTGSASTRGSSLATRPRPAGWWDGRPFDRILLDAPCSAIGVIRRHPDIKVLRRPEDVERRGCASGRAARGPVAAAQARRRARLRHLLRATARKRRSDRGLSSRARRWQGPRPVLGGEPATDRAWRGARRRLLLCLPQEA